MDTIPTDKKYAVDVNCDHATGTWDYEDWGVKVTKLSKNKVTCSLNFRDTVKELNGAVPQIENGLVAVIINPQTGEVTKANTKEKWYDYENKEWANAVILVDGKTEANYTDGQTIPDTDIESYFVWIPKYSYKLWNVDGTHPNDSSTYAIQIRFGTENTTDTSDSCQTPMNDNNTQGLSGQNKNCDDGDWMTHPAFISFNVNGFWVGKFETSDAGSSKAQIKPDVISWNNINAKTMFDASYSYQRGLDSHMMKNTEWGAVAYLSHSIYGTCTINNNETSCIEVSGNANSQFKTGYLDNTVFPNKDSGAASTTLNLTGIYDMNGGSNEWMANLAYDTDNQKIYLPNSSGFTNVSELKEEKYYDLYQYNGSNRNFTPRILGDATGENAVNNSGTGWSKNQWFASTTIPIFCRGSKSTELYGLFSFGNNAGQAWSGFSFRIVLAP